MRCGDAARCVLCRCGAVVAAGGGGSLGSAAAAGAWRPQIEVWRQKHGAVLVIQRHLCARYRNLRHIMIESPNKHMQLLCEHLQAAGLCACIPASLISPLPAQAHLQISSLWREPHCDNVDCEVS